MNKRTKKDDRFKRYIRRTWKNKLMALTLIGIGFISESIDGDGTFLVLALFFGLPLFFARRNYIY